MVAVFARSVMVNGTVFPPGHRADTVGLSELRFSQMTNLNRIIESEDPDNDRRWPSPAHQPAGSLLTQGGGGTVLVVADAQGVVTGAVPIPDAAVVETPSPSGQGPDGLWGCRAENCPRRLSSVRARDNHESKEHS